MGPSIWCSSVFARPVPELLEVHARVEHRRRVDVARPVLDSDRDLETVVAALREVMAARAGDRVVFRQYGVVEQRPSQLHLGGIHVNRLRNRQDRLLAPGAAGDEQHDAENHGRERGTRPPSG